MSTYLHFIGGYYDPGKFKYEARTKGVSRRVPITHVKRLKFGDTIVCAYWNNKMPYTFGKFPVTRIQVKEEITSHLQMALADKIVFKKDGAGITVRACGIFNSIGVIGVVASLNEVYEAAMEAYKELGVDPWFMVGCDAGEFEEQEVEWLEGVKFFRGLKRVDESSAAEEIDGQIEIVAGYKKRKSKSRADLQIALT